MSTKKYHCKGFNFTGNIPTIERVVKEIQGISIQEIDKNYLVLKYADNTPKDYIRRSINLIISEVEKERVGCVESVKSN